MKRLFTLLLSACTGWVACQGNGYTMDTKVIAHRGGASLGPENTISCIREGIATGVYAIEVDVHLSADGALVVCHDETIDRTTDGTGRIEELTLAQIRDAAVKGGAPGEQIPVLEEVLAEVKGKCLLLLEIKKTREGQYPLIEDKIVALLDSTGMRDQVIVQSFNDGVLERFHAIAPDIPLEKLLVCRLPFGLCYDIKVHRFSLDNYPYVQSFNIHNGLATKRFIRDVHALGKTVRVWTVNNPSKVKDGADAVITNHPQLFLQE